MDDNEESETWYRLSWSKGRSDGAHEGVAMVADEEGQSGAARAQRWRGARAGGKERRIRRVVIRLVDVRANREK